MKFLQSTDYVSSLAEGLQHLNRLQHQVKWELGANVSKDLETSDNLLEDGVTALTIEEQAVTQVLMFC